MSVEIIKKGLSGYTGDAWLVKKDDEYFVVSGTHAMFSGWEVLVFRANEDGEVTSWGGVCGGGGISHEQAIEQLENGETYDW